ncbi:hypothetical protein [Bradyrhizobium sp. JYMT SZCCT0428]|uniref:hypothetical protein n=1 Tax=Bradyrhizobium sp. JYMT SZCCT0428 TaxID=2807673 RepID=UPI001BA8800F|nr:hypothetical protein [Bradyrhizobium sp. JYMT SZCCT0428]MBR1154875.1 hypothetical protein [Bradyrhizobium sp. JYMT SZCCT0428]
MPDEPSSSADGERPTIDIHYQKSTEFREVACDGALGGPTPQGKVWLAFYNERFPLPRIVRQGLKLSEGESGFTLDNSHPAEIIEAKRGLIRSVEFGIYMSVDTAAELHEWLGKLLQETTASPEDT